MRKLTAALLTVLLALALTAIPALAANVHWVGDPVVTVTQNSVRVVGKLAGVGNESVTLVQDIDVAVTCANPGKNTDVPGQRKSFSSTIENVRPENGHILVDITTTVGDLRDACPNGKWVATGTIVGATLTVIQGGEVIFTDTLV